MTSPRRRAVLAVAAVGLLLGSCGSEAEGALSLPPENGGMTVTEALANPTDGSWIRGYIVAVRGEPARLCEALAESYPPQCAGASLVLQDGVLWRLPQQDSAIGSVRAGLLTSTSPGADGEAQHCGYEPGGPCAGFPGTAVGEGVWWTDIAFSAIGRVADGELRAIRPPDGADL